MPRRHTTRAMTTAIRMLKSGPTRAGHLSQAFDDGGVGHPAAFAHGLQAPAATGALELVEESRHEAGARTPERVAEGDGATVGVDLVHVGVVLLLPRQHDRSKGLVDLGEVDLVHRHPR